MSGLLTLKTDLKSLKYGHDTPGGGDSGQPYIKTDINTVDSGINKLRFTKFDDGLIRGGAVGAIGSSVVDTLRISKFLIDFPKGPLFIIKQVGLQLTNPRVESTILPTNKSIKKQGFLNNVGNLISNVANKVENAVGPTRIYNLGINTLAQVPINALGGHVVRHGFLPNNDSSKYYENVVREKNFQNNTNRLLDLTNNFNLGPWGANKPGVNKKEQGILNKLKGVAALNPINSTIFAGATAIFNTNKEFEIDSYLGGASSVYGIGTTTIRRALDGDTENKDKIEFAKGQSTTLAGKTRDKDGNVTDVAFGLDRLLGASNHTPSQLQNFTPSDSGPISNNDTYIPINLNDELANEKDKHDLNTALAGKTRDKNGNATEVAFGLDRLLGASNQTGSIFALPSEVKYPLTNNDTNIPVNLNNTIADNKDKHGTNKDNQIVSYDSANKNLTLGSFFGASNHASSSFRPFYFLSRTNNNNISSDPANSPLTLEERIPDQQTDYFHTRNPDSPELLNSHGLSAYTDLTPSAYEGPVDIQTINNEHPLNLPNLVYGVGASSYNNVMAAVDHLTAPNNLGIYAQLLNSQLNQERLPNSQYPPTYENYYGDKIVIKAANATGWNQLTREERVGSGRRDSLNLTPIFSDVAGSIEDTPGSTVAGLLKIPNTNVQTINDLVKFRIQAIDTDKPTQANWMIFRAYITDLSDSVDATWNPVKYAGRGDSFYIYDGFTRKMSVTFKVAALSRQEMEPMYQKLNYLMSNLMPDYSGVLMRGPIMRMTIGNWIDGQLCVLNSLSYKVPTDSPWEIGLNDEELILPHIVEVTLGFTPIGSQTRDKNELPRKEDCVSNIAQNWNGASEREYIVPCPEEGPKTTTTTTAPPATTTTTTAPPLTNPNFQMPLNVRDNTRLLPGTAGGF